MANSLTSPDADGVVFALDDRRRSDTDARRQDAFQISGDDIGQLGDGAGDVFTEFIDIFSLQKPFGKAACLGPVTLEDQASLPRACEWHDTGYNVIPARRGFQGGRDFHP